ncbi:MAG: PrsW family glutamic-type intramembrane protease [Patescibacteria group bacterium]|nr:PrsW family glutamic-type intramembrane protease [Patescibacteria group bacterium]
MNNLIHDPKTILFAIIGGVIPAILWLWFWFKEEDDEDPEPIGLIILSFILGALIVFLAIWLEKLSLNYILEETWKIITWASIEEILKFLGVAVIIFGTGIIKEPIDYPMYFIATALGFAALENVLFLLDPLQSSGMVVGIMTGNLRFLGSTLLHAIASGLVGIALGFSYHKKVHKTGYIIIGLLAAITLHSIFNFFIMKGSGENFLSVFGFLWVITIISILIFEKLRRMGEPIH